MPASATIDLLFVYGTLRRAAGHPAHRLLADSAEYLGSGTVCGRLYATADYAGLVPAPDVGTVTGEIYRLFDPSGTLARIDDYEGIDPASPEAGEFRRVMLPVLMADGRTVAAAAYAYQRPVSDLPPIPHGDFARHVREAPAPAHG